MRSKVLSKDSLAAELREPLCLLLPALWDKALQPHETSSGGVFNLKVGLARRICLTSLRKSLKSPTSGSEAGTASVHTRLTSSSLPSQPTSHVSVPGDVQSNQPNPALCPCLREAPQMDPHGNSSRLHWDGLSATALLISGIVPAKDT